MALSNIKIDRLLNKLNDGEIGGSNSFVKTYQLSDYQKEADSDWYYVDIEHNKDTLNPTCVAYHEENQEVSLPNFEVIDKDNSRYYTLKKFVLTVTINK